MALLIAFFVISLNSILQSSLASIPKALARCQEIASPSLSGSVARYTFFDFLARVLISFKTGPLPLMVIYCGSKLLSISTPSLLFGRSIICPTDAFTT